MITTYRYYCVIDVACNFEKLEMVGGGGRHYDQHKLFDMVVYCNLCPQACSEQREHIEEDPVVKVR